uniref:ATP-grasp domain-containing protein n=1 Tax=Eisenbergiella sp. TaxID=1924109 RepID=UPI003FEFF9EB
MLGIDYIYANGELYFIEINPRFQGSTRQLDNILKRNGLPSIFDYNYRAFTGKELPEVSVEWNKSVVN